MVRAMDGHGLRITSDPPLPGGTVSPSRSTTAGSMPRNGRVAEPGLVGTAPGIGANMMAPVSVCHQVSTIGHRPLPMISRYQIQASGLIGSPTVPKSRKLASERLRGYWSPHLMQARMAVGAV